MIEDERKYLVDRKKWTEFLGGHPNVYYRTFIQYYLHIGDNIEVRLRHIPDDFCGNGPENMLTIKFGGTQQRRVEINRQLTEEQAHIVAKGPVSKLIKRRYKVQEGVTVDEFVKPEFTSLCELENTSVQPEYYPFITAEVTGDPKYYNKNIAIPVDE